MISIQEEIQNKEIELANLKKLQCLYPDLEEDDIRNHHIKEYDDWLIWTSELANKDIDECFILSDYEPDITSHYIIFNKEIMGLTIYSRPVGFLFYKEYKVSPKYGKNEIEFIDYDKKKFKYFEKIIKSEQLKIIKSSIKNQFKIINLPSDLKKYLGLL